MKERGKMKKVFAIAGLFLAAVSAFSQNAWDFETETVNGTVTITGYTGDEKYIHIPERIYNRAVTAIGDFAFAEKQLTGVSIPYGVTSIGEGAFYGNRIKGVAIPSGVTSIGTAAFSNNEIKNVVIPNTVTAIGAGAFSNNCIKNITIPEGIASVTEYALLENTVSETRVSYNLTYF
jgi:hypothetical protein